MRRIGFEPVVQVSSVPEFPAPGEEPVEYTRRLAHLKAQGVAARLGAGPGNGPVADGEPLPMWVLSADTIVVHEGQILEKPADHDHAFAMLRKLSDSWHTVITTFCWMYRGAPDTVYTVRPVEAKVRFRALSDDMIRRYIATGEPMDKAGSYGIQDVGSTIVREIRGSYFCVVGLPVCEVVEALEELGGLEGYPFVAPQAGGQTK